MARTAPTAKDDILLAARRCFGSEGFRGTSIREIAAEYGGSKAAVLYHFESKDAILEALVADHWREIEALAREVRALPADIAQRRAADGITELAVRYRDDLAILHGEVTEIIRFERFKGAGAAFDEIAHALVGRSDTLPARIASHLLLGGVASVCHEFRTAPGEDLREGILYVMRSVQASGQHLAAP
ncbi:MAG TPA: helix-turn-helix domain-containing protein [Propionicimonas sp.]|jgi:AcrR family transcriptional regulator